RPNPTATTPVWTAPATLSTTATTVEDRSGRSSSAVVRPSLPMLRSAVGWLGMAASESDEPGGPYPLGWRGAVPRRRKAPSRGRRGSRSTGGPPGPSRSDTQRSEVPFTARSAVLRHEPTGPAEGGPSSGVLGPRGRERAQASPRNPSGHDANLFIDQAAGDRRLPLGHKQVAGHCRPSFAGDAASRGSRPAPQHPGDSYRTESLLRTAHSTTGRPSRLRRRPLPGGDDNTTYILD